MGIDRLPLISHRPGSAFGFSHFEEESIETMKKALFPVIYDFVEILSLFMTILHVTIPGSLSDVWFLSRANISYSMQHFMTVT